MNTQSIDTQFQLASVHVQRAIQHRAINAEIELDCMVAAYNAHRDVDDECYAYSALIDAQGWPTALSDDLPF